MDAVEERERKVSSNKKVNVNPAVDQDTHRKLKWLALACDVTKTTLAEGILQLAVNSIVH